MNKYSIAVKFISILLFAGTLSASEEVAVNTNSTQHKFLQLDRNQDKYISKVESLAEQPLNDTFENFDMNDDKKISVSEFRPYFNIRYGNIANAKASRASVVKPGNENAFYQLDKDKNNVLSIDEFANIQLNQCVNNQLGENNEREK